MKDLASNRHPVNMKAAPMRALAVAGGVAAWLVAAGARADDRRVVIARSGSEPSCIDVGELRAAVARDTALPVRVAPAPAEGEIVVRVAEEGSDVAIRIQGPGIDVKHALAAPACATVGDRVAAFVASTLRPAPALPPPPPPPPAPPAPPAAIGPSPPARAPGMDMLERIVAELRARNAAPRYATLAYPIDQDGVAWLEVTKPGTACKEVVRIGLASSVKPGAEGWIVDEAIAHVASVDGCKPTSAAPADRLLRAERLEFVLRPYRSGPSVASKVVPWLAMITGSMFTGSSFGLDDDRRRVGFVGFSTAWTLGGASAFGVPEAYRQTVLNAALLVGIGFAQLVNFPQADPRVAGTLAIAAFAQAGLDLTWGLSHPELGPTAAARHHAAVATPEQREKLTTAELERIEADVARIGWQMNPWRQTLPSFLGAAGGFALTFAGPPDKRAEGALASGMFLGLSLFRAVFAAPNGRRVYERALQGKYDWELISFGAGLGVRGRF
jgi:hypothetical protein